jgi:hypothetical protein
MMMRDQYVEMQTILITSKLVLSCLMGSGSSYMVTENGERMMLIHVARTIET